MVGTPGRTFSKQVQEYLIDAWLGSPGSFSPRIPCLLLALILASPSVVALGQENSGDESLADSVRSLNRKLETAPLFDRTALLGNLVERAGRLATLVVRNPVQPSLWRCRRQSWRACHRSCRALSTRSSSKRNGKVP
jgi:hypothetical protein